MFKTPDRPGLQSNLTTDSPVAPEVAVLGAAAVDWLARVEGMPPVDGIAFADQVTSVPGGSGGNVAEAVARLGHPVRFLGVLGDDEGGRLLWQAFEKAGVDTSCIRVEKGQRSAACFIAVDRHGQRMIFALGGVAIYERPADLTAGQLAGVKLLYIADAYPQVARAAISFLEPGGRVIFSPGGLMTASGLAHLLPILERTDVLILSRGEAQALTGILDPEQALLALAGKGPQAVVLTLGEGGALVVEKQAPLLIPAVRVGQVLDTTGAGDAFSAGVMTGLLEGFTLERAVRLGCAVAAHKIQHFGSRNGLPERAQIFS